MGDAGVVYLTMIRRRVVGACFAFLGGGAAGRLERAKVVNSNIWISQCAVERPIVKFGVSISALG